MTKDDWEARGLKKRVLANNLYFDPVTNSFKQIPTTTSGIEIDLINPSVLAKLAAIAAFPPPLMRNAMDVVEVIFTKYFDDKDRVQKQGEATFEIFARYQKVQIITQHARDRQLGAEPSYMTSLRFMNTERI